LRQLEAAQNDMERYVTMRNRFHHVRSRNVLGITSSLQNNAE